MTVDGEQVPDKWRRLMVEWKPLTVDWKALTVDGKGQYLNLMD